MDPRLTKEVSRLGRELGVQIKRHEGAEALDLVEKVRQLSKQDRLGDPRAGQSLQELLRKLSDKDLALLSKAFCEFMRIANTAEQTHRLRALSEGTVQRADRLSGVIESLKRTASAKRIKDIFAEMKIDLVLTAHPTEAMPPLTRRACRLLSDGLRENDPASLERGIETLWHSEAISLEKPTPLEEALSTFSIVEDSLWQSLPRAARLCEEVLGEPMPPDWSPFQFSSWMGGDRDGNPFVTAAMTRQIRQEARKKALRLFARDVERLADTMDFRGHGKGPGSPSLILLHWSKRFRQEIRLIEGGKEVLKPAREEEFLKSLLGIHENLLKQDLRAIASGPLVDTIRRVRGFGFGLFRLDIRQSSDVHEAIIDELTKGLWPAQKYSDLSEDEKKRFLLKKPAVGIPKRLSPAASDLRDLMRDIRDGARDGFNCFIVSMTETASDLFEALWLQKVFGLKQPLPVVPLFETPEALDQATGIMSDFWARSVRKGASSEHQIMLGYSDSTKRGGLLASAWSLHRVQKELDLLAKKHGQSVVFFHGRGGSIGRGGGPVRDALKSLPLGSNLHRIRITEQGESIESKFGLPGLADRNFELYLMAVLEARLQKPSPHREQWSRLMDELAGKSMKEFREFIYEDPEFNDFFYAVTPVEELSVLKIGSRPSRRKKDRSLESLRAIPWIFSWTQNRALLASWCGAGLSLTEEWDRGQGETLRSMYREWVFFQSVMDLLEMVLAKADMRTFHLYVEALLKKEQAGKAKEIEDRFARTVAIFQKILGEKSLLSRNSLLQESIEIRTRYVEVLNRLQVEVLKRRRHGKSNSTLDQALALTISGIAAGMRNTG